MKSNVKRLFAGPYILWMIGFTIIPLLLIVYYGLTTKSGAFTLANVCSITTPEHMKALLLSLGLSLAATAICLLLSYPLALVLRRRGIGAGSFMVFVFILPMWMNFLLRTLAWQTLLEKNGVINGILSFLHLPNIAIINTPWAIILGMVYNFLPFMILPILSVLEKIDPKVIEAAQDLGANSFTVFRRVTFPLSLPGVLSGVTMVFIPSVSTFVISRLLGGGKSLLLGDLIEMQFMGTTYNPWLGSAIALVMMVIVLVCMAIMNRFGEGEEGVSFL